MRRELIESYYEEYQRELERFLESDPESEKCHGRDCGKRNVYPGISGL